MRKLHVPGEADKENKEMPFPLLRLCSLGLHNAPRTRRDGAGSVVSDCHACDNVGATSAPAGEYF